MTNPKISDAKAICQSLGARSVILIVIDKDRYASVSYGETKAECTMTGRLLDRICEKVLAES
jgi:hypothetical protein